METKMLWYSVIWYGWKSLRGLWQWPSWGSTRCCLSKTSSTTRTSKFWSSGGSWGILNNSTRLGSFGRLWLQRISSRGHMLHQQEHRVLFCWLFEPFRCFSYKKAQQTKKEVIQKAMYQIQKFVCNYCAPEVKKERTKVSQKDRRKWPRSITQARKMLVRSRIFIQNQHWERST